jgi:hypothetical protein
VAGVFRGEAGARCEYGRSEPPVRISCPTYEERIPQLSDQPSGGDGGSDNMTLLYSFAQLNMVSADLYDRIIRRLEERGAGAPPGRLYHVAYGNPEQLKVDDVWESAQQLHKFGEALIPTVEELGLILLEPDVRQIYHIITPQRRPVVSPAPCLARFDPPRMNAGQYNEIIKRLDEAGLGAPPERLYDVCYWLGDELRIISVWQDEKALRTFFSRVVDLTADVGISEIPPTAFGVERVHHIIDGSHPSEG